VTWAIKDKSYSQRRACALVGLQAKTYRYASRRSDEAPIRHRLLELAQQRRRFGYRRLHLLLRREGVMLNHKKLYRLYREERLMVRKRGGRKRAIGTRAPMALPQGPNRRWSLDFVSDALACGRKFRVLAVVDDFTRECLALIVDNSLSGIRVARELDRIVERRDRPCLVVSDNGTELTSRAILGWQQDQGIEWHYIAPASRPRTASSNRSTVGCATNASTNICSPISPRLAGSSKPGASTTTPCDHTRALAGSHQRSLQHAPTRGITRTDSPSERGHSGEHVR